MSNVKYETILSIENSTKLTEFEKAHIIFGINGNYQHYVRGGK